MINKLLGYVEGADVYMIIALFLFMLVFVFAGIQMLTMKKAAVKELSMLPFNQDNDENNEK